MRPAPSRAVRIAATWPSIIPLGATTSAPAGRLGQRHLLVELEGGVVVDGSVGAEHAAVTVIGVLVQAQVGDEHHGVAQTRCAVRPEPPARRLRVPRARPHGVFAFGDPEQHDPGDPQRRQSLRLHDQRRHRMLEVAGQRGDRDRVVHRRPHEQGRHEIVDSEARLGHQATQGGSAAQPAHPPHGEAGTDHRSSWRAIHVWPAYARAGTSSAGAGLLQVDREPVARPGPPTLGGGPVRRGAQKGPTPGPRALGSTATTSTRNPARRAASAVTGPMHATTGGRAAMTGELDVVRHRGRRGERDHVGA